MTDPLPAGSTIGILGGGQLGRMLSVAAARLGYKTCVLDPASDCPASHVANYHLRAAYDDAAALENFAKSVDVVTYEFENIPTTALDVLGAARDIHPNRTALATSQDRLTEKDFLSGLGLTTAPYANVETKGDLAQAIAQLGTPAILKTRRFGYDGKGQARLTTPADASEAWQTVGTQPSVLEGFIDFASEVSVIAARSLDGSVACFDPGQNVHEAGILRTTTVPAAIPPRLRTDAVLIASRIVTALDYVGVIGVELFVTPQGLIINEFAPRVHNSGHWTQNGCAVDQFEQHIRAITGWPLGDGSRHSNVVMENLIGDDIARLPAHAAEGAAIHLYGKSEARPGRKMGHVNRVTPLS